MVATINDELRIMPHVLELCGSRRQLALDGGANVGHFTAEMNKHFKHVIAVEPVTKTFKALKDRFHQRSDVTLVNQALWHTPERMLYMAHPAKRTKSTSYYLTTDEQNAEHQVLTTTIDNLVEGWPIDFVKLDLEGSEMDALMGATETIQRKPVLLIECIEKTMNHYGYGVKFVDRWLTERGYTLRREDGINRLYA